RAFLDIVHGRWSLKDSKRADPIALRTAVWQDVLVTAHKQWVRENIPMGLVACSLSISPILVRRNHLSIYFPSTNSLISQSSELRDTILPMFASFPASKLYASLIKEWQADVQPDVVSPMNLSEALQVGVLKDINEGRGIPAMLARLSTILTGDASTQISVLDALLEHVKLPSATAVAAPVTSVDLSLALHRMSTVVVQELWTTSCRSAFLLGFLLDAQPPFLAAETLAHIESTTLPNLLTSLRTWGFGKWILSQQHANAVPILQDFASHMLDDILSASTGLGAAVTSFLRELLFEQNNLVAYLKTHKLYCLLRVTLRQLLSHADQTLTTQYTFLLAECFLVEGAHTENEESKLVCLDRAVRYFVLVAHSDASVVVEITSKLKEHLHRASSKYIIDFLRSSLINIDDSVTQEFVWYNLFKLMIQEAEYQDAYSALQHLARLETSAESLQECVRHFVLQLCDAGRHDVICEFSWGSFEPQVEDLLVWQAANTHANIPVSRSSQSASSLYRLLYSFYMQRSRYVHAARAMYSLYLRLQTEAFSTSVLETQRDALLATLNVLQLAPEEHRWFACNLQAEQTAELTVISEADVNRQLLSVRGMLALPTGCFAMGTLAAPEIISLLLTNLDRNARLATKATELAVAIAEAHELDLSVVIRSLSRAFATGNIAEQVVEVVLEHLNDTALYLTAVESLVQLRFAIPEWLHKRAMDYGQALLALYLKYGALDDAMATAHILIPATINLSTTEFDQVSKKIVSTWIPYALLDTLLESTKRVVSEHEAQGKSTEIAQLKQDATALTSKLGAYFKLNHFHSFNLMEEQGLMGQKEPQTLQEKLYQVDLQIAVRIYAVFGHSKSWRMFFEALSLTGDGILWLLIVLPLLVVAWVIGWLVALSNGQKAFISFFYVCQFVDILCIIVFKLLFHRKRPPHHQSDDRFVGPDQHSFPSGHATRSWCLVGLVVYLSQYYPRALTDLLGLWAEHAFASIMVIWAILICFSRLALGRHYPSDILAGACIGFFLEFPLSALAMHFVFPTTLNH
ncbi:phosphatidic acid phosphatase, partial [Thraustotheca clavata]